MDLKLPRRQFSAGVGRNCDSEWDCWQYWFAVLHSLHPNLLGDQSWCRYRLELDVGDTFYFALVTGFCGSDTDYGIEVRGKYRIVACHIEKLCAECSVCFTKSYVLRRDGSAPCCAVKTVTDLCLAKVLVPLVDLHDTQSRFANEEAALEEALHVYLTEALRPALPASLIELIILYQHECQHNRFTCVLAAWRRDFGPSTTADDPPCHLPDVQANRFFCK